MKSKDRFVYFESRVRKEVVFVNSRVSFPFLFDYLLSLFAYPSPTLSKNYELSTNSIFFMRWINVVRPSGREGISCPLMEPIRTQDSLHIVHERYGRCNNPAY